MSPPELRDLLRTLAVAIAQGHYARQNPAASEDESWAWAERSSYLFKEQALDLAALLAAEHESGQQARDAVN